MPAAQFSRVKLPTVTFALLAFTMLADSQLVKAPWGDLASTTALQSVLV